MIPRISLAILAAAGLALAGCGGGGGGKAKNKLPDKVQSTAAGLSARFHKSPTTTLGFDDTIRRGYDRDKKPYTPDAWPWKAVQLNASDPINLKVTGFKAGTIFYGHHADNEISLPNEAVAVAAADEDRGVRGDALANGFGFYSIGYALVKNEHIGGFYAKVYERKKLKVGRLVVKAAGQADFPVPTIAKLSTGTNKAFNQAAVDVEWVDMGTTVVNYDVNGNGALGYSTTNGHLERPPIITAVRGHALYASVQIVAVRVSSIDTFPAGFQISGVNDMVFVASNIRGDDWEVRATAHEIGHIFGLDEYENTSLTTDPYRDLDLANLMWSFVGHGAVMLEMHLRAWQWDAINLGVK